MKLGKPSLIPDKPINVEKSERIASATAGGLLLAIATQRGGFLKSLLGGYLLFRGVSGYCPGYEALEDKGVRTKPRNVRIRTSITVNKPRQEVYEFWRKLENLPLFMTHLKSVKVLTEKTSEWKAKVPKGLGSIGWKSEIVEDETNKRIGWKSMPGSSIDNAGNVHFKDAGEFGTEVHAEISYHAPVGKPGEGVAHLLNPLFGEMVKEDVKNFKRYMETGELPTIEGQPKG